MPGRSRVYTLLAISVAVALAASWAPARSVHAQFNVSIDPAMTKGAPDARITIYEFSDYE
jgi:hypothetical protein